MAAIGQVAGSSSSIEESLRALLAIARQVKAIREKLLALERKLTTGQLRSVGS